LGNAAAVLQAAQLHKFLAWARRTTPGPPAEQRPAALLGRLPVDLHQQQLQQEKVQRRELLSEGSAAPAAATARACLPPPRAPRPSRSFCAAAFSAPSTVAAPAAALAAASTAALAAAVSSTSCSSTRLPPRAVRRATGKQLGGRSEWGKRTTNFELWRRTCRCCSAPRPARPSGRTVGRLRDIIVVEFSFLPTYLPAARPSGFGADCAGSKAAGSGVQYYIISRRWASSSASVGWSPRARGAWTWTARRRSGAVDVDVLCTGTRR
jgi:hypothetical protein